MKRAIVLGATGLVGREIVSQLSSNDSFEEIISISRRKVNYDSPKVTNIVVDFCNLKNYKDSFYGDILFSALGTTVKVAGSIKEQRRVDYSYQFEIAEMASELGVKKYFLVSSSGANPKSSSPYLKMKGKLEASIKSLRFTQTIIFRPSLLLGKRNRFRPGEFIGTQILPFVCKLPGLTKYRPIHASQVASAMIKLSQYEEAGDRILELDEIFI